MNQLNLKKSLLVLQKDRKKNKPEVIQRLKSQRGRFILNDDQSPIK